MGFGLPSLLFSPWFFLHSPDPLSLPPCHLHHLLTLNLVIEVDTWPNISWLLTSALLWVSFFFFYPLDLEPFRELLDKLAKEMPPLPICPYCQLLSRHGGRCKDNTINVPLKSWQCSGDMSHVPNHHCKVKRVLCDRDV